MSTFIVMDLEWNQSPYGKDKSIEALPSEIIEIGAVKLDERLQTVSTYHQLVKPQVYRGLSRVTAKMTHLNMKELQYSGLIFPRAIKQFLNWCGKDYRFCTWGPADMLELQRNIAYYGIRNPFEFPLYYYDVQKLCGLEMGNDKEKLSLEHAIDRLGIKTSHPFHRALDDAYYTGKVMQVVDFERWKSYVSVDYFRLPSSREEEIYLDFPTYSKYVSRVFPSRTAALSDRQVTSVVCRQCGRRLRKKIQWFSLNQKQYFCLAVCPEHGYIRGKLRMKKVEDDAVYVIKTVKPADEASIQNLTEKKKEYQKKRRRFLRKMHAAQKNEGVPIL